MARDFLIPIERVASKIYVIRSEKVPLDEDLAKLYGVPTKRLNEQVTRNRERFPTDFMFRLSTKEFGILKSQFATSRWGGRRISPRAFAEQGVAMLSFKITKCDLKDPLEMEPITIWDRLPGAPRS